MNRSFTVAALLLAGTSIAAAQTVSPAGSCGTVAADPMQLAMPCTAPSDTGGTTAVGGTTTSSEVISEETMPPLTVPNDPVGMGTRANISPAPAQGSVDTGTTSALPAQRQGMAPLVVPNDPLGMSTRPAVPPVTQSGNPAISGGSSGISSGGSGVSSPAIQ